MKNLRNNMAGIRSGGRQGGFSILEVLIALLIASIVISVAFELYLTQHNQLLVQEDVSEIQGNARAAAELLAQEIRNTGFLLPPVVTTMEATDSNPDTLVIKYATPALAGVVLCNDMSSGTDNIQCMGNPLTGLAIGDWVYIYDPDADTGEVFTVTDINNASQTIFHALNPLVRSYPAGSQLFKVKRDRFYIDRSDRAHPNLMIQKIGEAPEVYAENIEHLDFVYYMEDGTSTSMYTNPADVRMIEINVRAKSFRPDLNSPNGEIRKRDFSLKVKLRNFGLSS